MMAIIKKQNKITSASEDAEKSERCALLVRM